MNAFGRRVRSKEAGMKMSCKQGLKFFLICISIVVFQSPLHFRKTYGQAISGNSQIKGQFGASEIVITTTDRLAGAIHSLTWNGKEFIDSVDHGRQLQSACSFDTAKPGEFWAEAYNPTEAGSRADSAGPVSTSRLLKLRAERNVLETTTRMAFWLAPGEDSSGRPALNQSRISNHTLTKRVEIGYKNHPNIIQYKVTFHIPAGERHKLAQLEALTGYMPAEFSRFWKFEPKTGELQPLDDGPGEQKLPVVLSTEDKKYAMGIISPNQPSRGFENAGYGRFRFVPEKVVKWNCVFRERNTKGIVPGDRTFQMFVVLGTLEDVKSGLIELIR